MRSRKLDDHGSARPSTCGRFFRTTDPSTVCGPFRNQGRAQRTEPPRASRGRCAPRVSPRTSDGLPANQPRATRALAKDDAHTARAYRFHGAPSGVPRGIRTPVPGMKTLCPGPLDDGDGLISLWKTNGPRKLTEERRLRKNKQFHGNKIWELFGKCIQAMVRWLLSRHANPLTDATEIDGSGRIS